MYIADAGMKIMTYQYDLSKCELTLSKCELTFSAFMKMMYKFDSVDLMLYIMNVIQEEVRLLETREGQGNAVQVSKTCNPWGGLVVRGFYLNIFFFTIPRHKITSL